MKTARGEATAPVRVLVVDDVDDVRMILRLQLELDGRFEVVGEASDGNEAIELVGKLHPDLVILDRNMPGRGGIETIGPLREIAPDTAVVLYTAQSDSATHHAALAAGALDVLTKTAGPEFIDEFTAGLLDRVHGPNADVEVRVGPVSSVAARTWIANSKRISAAVADHPEVVDVDPDVLGLLRELLDEWEDVARSSGEFVWVARADRDELTRIVEEWAAIDGMTPEQLSQLGVAWSPPEGQPFFQALTDGVLGALERHEGTRRLAARLTEQWAPYREDAPAWRLGDTG